MMRSDLAFSLVVVCAAALFLETFQRLESKPIGFDADRILVVTVDTSRASVAPKDRDWFSRRLVSAVAAVPGVSQAAASMATPGLGGAPIFSRTRAAGPWTSDVAS